MLIEVWAENTYPFGNFNGWTDDVQEWEINKIKPFINQL